MYIGEFLEVNGDKVIWKSESEPSDSTDIGYLLKETNGGIVKAWPFEYGWFNFLHGSNYDKSKMVSVASTYWPSQENESIEAFNVITELQNTRYSSYNALVTTLRIMSLVPKHYKFYSASTACSAYSVAMSMRADIKEDVSGEELYQLVKDDDDFVGGDLSSIDNDFLHEIADIDRKSEADLIRVAIHKDDGHIEEIGNPPNAPELPEPEFDKV